MLVSFGSSGFSSIKRPAVPDLRVVVILAYTLADEITESSAPLSHVIEEAVIRRRWEV